MNSRRVVITGMGVISPLGITLESLWDALMSGRSGVAAMESVPSEFLPFHIAGEARDCRGTIDDFGELPGDVKKAIRKGLKVMCRESLMGVASAQRALGDAAVQNGSLDPDRSGVVFGSDYMLTRPEEFAAGVAFCRDEAGGFQFERWGAEGMPKVTPLWLLKYLPNMPASHIAIYNDLRGPNNSLTQREAASNLAIGEAARIIARGHADVMLAGATGTRVHPMKSVQALLQEEMATGVADPAAACRPFDLSRTGMVIGEGAGTIVLEELEAAQRRGARIYAEIVAAASSAVADRHLVARRDAALTGAISATLRQAEARPEDIGHVHAHGLGTRGCDVDEARAIAAIFGDRPRPVPVTAAKSYFGQLGAGSGTVELIASVLALADGRLPPVLNYETPDPDCPLSVATSTDTPAGDSFLNLNVTPQGQAAAVLVRRVDAASCRVPGRISAS